MAETRAVWGIDIGQAGLKAIRLRYSQDADQVLALAFDYVPHPKILSQPDAIPEELIPQALEKFLSRNEVKGDLVAISVPGQTALARFIQLPPVESSKISEIVKYEARQQIPFPLDEVIWDYQTLGGGIEESGFMLEAEVGLFAMKREQVMQHLKSFTQAKVEVELIQIAPLGLYNYLSYDKLGIRPDQEQESPTEYTIVLDMGSDNTTLLVSNGQKIWIRNVPIGGNHFTRALTKEMKLTFAKAEHLKCNATKSPDPRAVFQALRPVFNDYVSEIQRSIGYFSSVNRDAKIGKVIGLGNGFKLAGLQKFLQQNLQYEVERVDTFDALSGDAVLNAPLFQENILSFAVPYGLALQLLQRTRIHTSLLPPEIATARMIRGKKPWAVASAAALLFGFAISVAAAANVYRSVSPERCGEAVAAVDKLVTTVGTLDSDYTTAFTAYSKTQTSVQQLVKPLAEREYWLEVYRAINESLPRAQGTEEDIQDPQKRPRIDIKAITTEKVIDLSQWHAELSEASKGSMTEADKTVPPSGEGYVFTLECVHHHSGDDITTQAGIGYVEHTLLKNLKEWTIQPADGSPPVPIGKIGISHPVILGDYDQRPITYDPENPENREASNPTPGAATGAARPGFGTTPPTVPRAPVLPSETATSIQETTCVVQFVWKKTPPDQRQAERPKSAAPPAKKAETKK